MMESEHLIRPLEGVLRPRDVQHYYEIGIKGVIQIEMSPDELISIAENKGYETEWFLPQPRKGDRGMLSISTNDLINGIAGIVFFTTSSREGQRVYFFDRDFPMFKKLFFER